MDIRWHYLEPGPGEAPDVAHQRLVVRLAGVLVVPAASIRPRVVSNNNFIFILTIRTSVGKVVVIDKFVAIFYLKKLFSPQKNPFRP